MDTKQEIRHLAQRFFEETVAIRRHFHQYPELSFEEFGTSDFIQQKLTALGIPFRNGIVKTGIIGRLEGRNPLKRTVALRADMDALPVQEKNNLPFRSVHTGKMHACGHDLHMSVLLGTAMILKQLKDSFEGTILLVFQPGEEKIPGGANLMIKEGVFDGQPPDLFIGHHGLPGLPAGTVGFLPGVIMASSDEIYLTVKGKGGHAAMPHQLVDSVLISAHVIVALQQLVSRMANPFIPTVLSFGKVDAPGATNIIPDEVKIAGTFRTMNEQWREHAHRLIADTARSVAQSMGGDCEIDILKGYPVLENHPEFTRRARAYSSELLGEENILPIERRMTSEDFAYYSIRFPAVFYRFGTTDKEKLYTAPLHSPHYMADESGMLTAMANMAWLAVSFLNEP